MYKRIYLIPKAGTIVSMASMRSSIFSPHRPACGRSGSGRGSPSRCRARQSLGPALPSAVGPRSLCSLLAAHRSLVTLVQIQSTNRPQTIHARCTTVISSNAKTYFEMPTRRGVLRAWGTPAPNRLRNGDSAAGSANANRGILNVIIRSDRWAGTDRLWRRCAGPRFRVC